MPQTNVNRATGLYTFPNQLGELPVGALTQADNVVIDRDGVISPRRGLALYGSAFGISSDTAKQLLYYKGRVLRHWGTSLDFDNDGAGTFVNLSSAITEQASGTRIKFQEMNGNLYFTTNEGVQKISATSASGVSSAGVTTAGGIEAMDGVAYLNSTEGWFTQDSTVAYRIVWGITDNNNNLVLGNPSQQIIATNSQFSLLLNDYNKLLSALDIVASFSPIVLTGNTHTSTTIDGLSSTANLSVGMTVSATDVPANTTIVSIVNSTTITINNATTASTTGESITFGQKLTDTTFSSLALSSSASSVDLYNGLQNLAQKLDTDLGEIGYYGRSGNITGISATINFTLTGNSDFSSTITNLSSLTNITSGLFVSGVGVPSNTVVNSTTISGASITGVTGSLTLGSTQITVSSGASLTAGLTISGNGIPSNTTILNVSGTTVTMSAAATISASGVPLNFTSYSITLSNTVSSNATNATFTFSYPTTVAAIGHGLSTNDQVIISGTDSTPSIDTTNPVTITALSANVFSVPETVTVGGTKGTWKEYPLAIAQNYPTAPYNPATTAQLVTLQEFYDAIVTALNSDVNIAVAALATIGGSFSSSTQSATTNIVFTIPSQITTDYFYQVYRGDMTISSGPTYLSDQTPDDECRLIAEANPTSTDISNGYINFYDNVAESFRQSGAALYTNAISGSGILQENTPPPYCQDITLWMNYMFFANVSSKHFIQLDLLTGSGLVGNTFSTTLGSTTTTYTFVNDVNQVTSIVLPAGSAFPSSGSADYFDIYSAQNYVTYRFYFKLGTVTAPSSAGVTLIPVNILSTDTAAEVASKLQYTFFTAYNDLETSISSSTLTVTNLDPGYTNTPSNHVTAAGFSITVTTSGTGEKASTQSVGVPNSPTPAQQIDAVARSLVRIINKNSAGGIWATYLSGPSDLPGQILLTAIKTNLTPFYLTAASSIGSLFSPALPSSGTTVASDNNSHPNYIYYSKVQEPDAVPQVNYFAVGQEDYPILRIVALRDSLFILKADGVYRLYGTDPSNFSIYLFDSSTKLLAQDTAAVLNNQVYMLSNQGVVTVSDVGISVLSRPIESAIVPVNIYNNFTSISFSVAYEADRAYMLWIQGASTDTQATVCYRYNTFTNTWVSWPITKTCGVVVPDTNILYVGPGDTNYVEQERKSYSRFDQADRSYNQTIPASAINGTVLSLGSVYEAKPGDAIVQTQYLTIDQYNRLINKLGTDTSLQNNYSGQLAIAGDDLRGHLTNLAALLDTDGGLATHNYSSSISGYSNSFPDTQSAFNEIVTLLNADSGSRLHNFTKSTYTTGWESIVQSIDTVKQTITVADSLPWIQGAVTIYKAIDSQVEWAPEHAGDPALLKKMREGTMMFENMAFDNAIVSYSSDLYTGQTQIPFTGDGCDIWGGVVWGQGTWGGDGTARPMRTYVPVPVQRCRYIQAYFEHNTALRLFSIFGISYTWEPVSYRAYR